MKIECEIEWVPEDSNLDEEIKSKILSKATEKVKDTIYKDLEKRASDALAGHIDDLMAKLTDRFMNREIVVTDKWGDQVETHESVNDLLKSKFDSFTQIHVDSKGNPVSRSCSVYGKQTTRVEYLIDTQLNKLVEGLMTTVERGIKEAVNKIKEEATATAIAAVVKKMGL